MNHITSWALRLFALLFTISATAQQPPESLEWFNGDWEIQYKDDQLGDVRGLAKVRVENDGALLVRYFLTDPRDGSTHELTPYHIHQEGGVITMDLGPGGPVAVLDSEGRPINAATNANRIAAPGGARLQAALGEQKAEAGVLPVAAKIGTSLRLTRVADRIEGEWLVRRDPGSGFQGARCGKRDTLTTVLPEPIGEMKEEVMRGPETWQSAGIIVEGVYRNRWEDPKAPGASAGRAHVGYKGKNIPETKRREVRFVDPQLRADNSPEWGGSAVDVSKRAVPGLKTFSIKDKETTQQAMGVWNFDFPNLQVKSIHFARRTAGGDFEPTGIIYFGEWFFLEAELRWPAPGDMRRYGMLTNAGDPVYFHMQRDPRARAKFRAGPFLLLGLADDPPQGSIDVPAIGVDPTRSSAPTDSVPFVIRASRGARIIAAPAGGNLGEPMDSAIAEAKEDHSEDGPYQRALRMAEDFRRRYPDPDRYNISKFTPLSGSRRTNVTVQDHAALILLQGELLRNLDTARRRKRKARLRSNADGSLPAKG
jgi:hypothetical protein